MSIAEILGLALIILAIVWLKWFSEGWIESREWQKRERIKGEQRWQWLINKPYITPKKIIYWLFIIIIITIYMYIGFNLPI
jgi:hypothetical protein